MNELITCAYEKIQVGHQLILDLFQAARRFYRLAQRSLRRIARCTISKLVPSYREVVTSV